MRAWPYQQWDFTTLCAHLSEIFHVDSYECSTIHASSVAATSALPASFAMSDAVFPRRSVSRQSAPRPRSHSTGGHTAMYMYFHRIAIVRNIYLKI